MRREFAKSVTVAAIMLAATSHAAGGSSQGTWETTLLGRDVASTGVVDAYYDTVLNITWLRNADVNGRMDWTTASIWATNLTVGAYSGWRLPSALNRDGTGPCYGYCPESELGYIYYVELGNKLVDPTGNRFGGNFQNLHLDYTSVYWTQTAFAPGFVWVFDSYAGGQYDFTTGAHFFAWAVHDGDIGRPVPEPGSLLMMLAGCLTLGIAFPRRPALV